MTGHATKRDARKDRAAGLRDRLERHAAGDVSPLALQVHRALRDRPAWRAQPPSWIAVAMWAHGYAEEKPSGPGVAEALEELRAERERRAS